MEKLKESQKIDGASETDSFVYDLVLALIEQKEKTFDGIRAKMLAEFEHSDTKL